MYMYIYIYADKDEVYARMHRLNDRRLDWQAHDDTYTCIHTHSNPPISPTTYNTYTCACIHTEPDESSVALTSAAAVDVVDVDEGEVGTGKDVSDAGLCVEDA